MSDIDWRYFAWALCPHEGKYGDDGEMQCRGADFRRGNVAELGRHVVDALIERDARLRTHVENLEKLEPWWGGVLKRSVQRAGALQRATAAIAAILAEPYGCPFCNSGALRNPAKDHDSSCGFAMARAFVDETRTCFRVGKCRQPRNHTGPCDDWTSEEERSRTESDLPAGFTRVDPADGFGG